MACMMDSRDVASHCLIDWTTRAAVRWHASNMPECRVLGAPRRNVDGKSGAGMHRLEKLVSSHECAVD